MAKNRERARKILESVNAPPQQPQPGGMGSTFTQPDRTDPAGSVATFNQVWDYDNPTVPEQWETLDHHRGPYGAEETNKQWWQHARASEVRRWRQEHLYSDPDTFDAVQGTPRFEPDPRTIPVLEDHVKETPSVYRFFRPYDQRFEHRASGEHFSMASHMRQYPIYGMEPFPEYRNTFRMEPPPRDVTIVDYPPRGEPNTPPAAYVAPSGPTELFGDPNAPHRL